MTEKKSSKKAAAPAKPAPKKPDHPDQQQQNAINAGWDPAQGAAPHRHGEEHGDDVVDTPGDVQEVSRMVRESTAATGAPVDVNAVLQEMQTSVGFIEGPNDQNPWGEEQGAGDAAYCCSYACMIPYHHGYHWPDDCQFGEKGDAYVPYRVAHAKEQGEWVEDHASQGNPADVIPGDQLVYVWPGGDGAGDHIETALSANADGTTTNIGANTASGQPADGHQGVKLVTRSRKYLLGRIRPSGYVNGGVEPTPPPPPPPPPHAPDGNPYTMLDVDGEFGPQTTKGLQWTLNATGANPPLDIDGDFGPRSKVALQARLNYTNGPVAIDGEIGPQTIKALQAHTGATVDGQWGPDTSRHLQQAINAGIF